MSIVSRARTILARGNFTGYRHLEDNREDQNRLARMLSLLPNEVILGIYENDPSVDCSIVITDNALRLLRTDSETDIIRYTDIRSVSGPSSVEETAPRVIVTLHDGSATSLPITGRRGKFMDVFEFLRFLMRIVSDLQNQQD
jgi:hypothetical protein